MYDFIFWKLSLFKSSVDLHKNSNDLFLHEEKIPQIS